MPLDNFYLCLHAMCAFLDSGREVSDEGIYSLEEDIKAMSLAKRSEIRRQIVLVVAQLSRLEMRLFENHGANDAIV